MANKTAAVISDGAWLASTAYSLGDTVSNDTLKIYKCITAGTSASSGGPTGTGSDITDNTVHWAYQDTVGAAYTSLNAALSGESANLVTNTCILTIDCYPFQDNQFSTGTGYTVSSSYYINIKAHDAHGGKWNTSVHRVRAYTCTIYEEFTKLTGLQLDIEPDINWCYGFTTEAAGVTMAKCIARGTNSNAANFAYGFNWNVSADTNKIYVIDCTAYDFNQTSSSGGFYNSWAGTWGSENVFVLNCTSVNCYLGFKSGGGGSVCAKNCLAVDCTDGYYDTFSSNSTNNGSDIASDPPGSNSIDLSSYADTDIFYAPASDDFHLKSGSPCLNVGIDLSATFTYDIDGETRPTGSGTWDIGADEYISAGDTHLFVYQSTGESLATVSSVLNVLRRLPSASSGESNTAAALSSVLRLMPRASIGESLTATSALLVKCSFVHSVIGESLTSTPVANILRSIPHSVIGESNTAVATAAVLRVLPYSVVGESLTAISTLLIKCSFSYSATGESVTGVSTIIQTMVSGGRSFNLVNSADRYAFLMSAGGQDFAWSTTAAQVDQVVTSAGVFKKLRVLLSDAPGSGKSYTFTLYKNGNPTSLTVTISDSGTTAVDTTNSVIVEAGDKVALKCSPSGTPTVTTSVHAVDFHCYSTESIYGCHVVGGFHNSATRYLCPIGASYYTNDTDITYKYFVVPTSGTIKNLYAALVSAPGSGKSYALTFYKNGSPTSLAISIADDATENNNTSNSISVVAGDLIAIQVVPSGTPTISEATIGFSFTADTFGDFLFLFDVGVNFDANRFFEITAFGDTEYTDIDVRQRQLANSFTMKKILVSLNTAPGDGNSKTFTFRKNGVDQTLAVTISGADTSGSISTNISISDGDLLNTYVTGSGTPAASCYRISYVGYNADLQPNLNVLRPCSILSEGESITIDSILATLRREVLAAEGESLLSTPIMNVVRLIPHTSIGESLTADVILSILRRSVLASEGESLTSSSVMNMARAFAYSSVGESLTSDSILGVIRPQVWSAIGESLTAASTLDIITAVLFVLSVIGESLSASSALNIVRPLTFSSVGESNTVSNILSVLRALACASTGESLTVDSILGILRPSPWNVVGESLTSDATMALVRGLSWLTTGESLTATPTLLNLLSQTLNSSGESLTSSSVLAIQRRLVWLSTGESLTADAILNIEAILRQYSFRFINDNGDEDESTFRDGLNTNISILPGNIIRLRFLLDLIGDVAGKQFQIEYRRKPAGGEFGDWKKIV